MLSNFHLAAIAKSRTGTSLFHIPLYQELQESLAESWGAQYEQFMTDITEIDFDIGYIPEGDDCFRLVDYEAPKWLATEDSSRVASLEIITSQKGILEITKAIAAFARDAKGTELVLFQNFSKSRVIRPGRSLFLRHGTYRSEEQPGLILDGKLCAVYLPTQGKLLFRNFRNTNTFLPLAEVYRDASDREIREVLSHERLAPEDIDASIAGATQWVRKRVAMLRDSGLLEKYSPQEIRSHAENYSVQVNVVRGKLVFPSDKHEAKRLLQFLNEEIFRGAITEKLYETNSHRASDP